MAEKRVDRYTICNVPNTDPIITITRKGSWKQWHLPYPGCLVVCAATAKIGMADGPPLHRTASFSESITHAINMLA